MFCWDGAPFFIKNGFKKIFIGAKIGKNTIF